MGIFEDLIRTFSGDSAPAPDTWATGPSEETLLDKEKRKRALQEAYRMQYGPVTNILDPSVDELYELEDIKAEREAAVPDYGSPDYDAAAARAGLRRDLVGQDPADIRGKAQEAIANVAPPEEQAVEDDLQKLIAAGQRASEQREFMQGTVPLVEDYESGIAIGGDPSRGSKEEIIARIRAQAAKMAGREGPSAGGGGFSQGTMTPEIAQREASRDIWANQQPMRDAEFALTRGQVERSPGTAQAAASTLSDMQRNQALQREQAMQSALVQSLGANGGKIPFEKAQQLQAAGVNIPYSSIGVSKEDAIGAFDSAISEAGKFLSGVNQLDLIGNDAAKNRIVMERYGASLASMYKQKVAAGMNPDQALKEFQQQMASMMMEAGFLNTNEMVGPAPEAQ